MQITVLERVHSVLESRKDEIIHLAAYRFPIRARMVHASLRHTVNTALANSRATTSEILDRFDAQLEKGIADPVRLLRQGSTPSWVGATRRAPRQTAISHRYSFDWYQSIIPHRGIIVFLDFTRRFSRIFSCSSG